MAPPLKPHLLKQEAHSELEVFSLTLFCLYFNMLLTVFFVFLTFFCYRWGPPKCPLHCTLQHITLAASTTFFSTAFLIIKSIYGGQSAPECIPRTSLLLRGNTYFQYFTTLKHQRQTQGSSVQHLLLKRVLLCSAPHPYSLSHESNHACFAWLSPTSLQLQS